MQTAKTLLLLATLAIYSTQASAVLVEATVPEPTILSLLGLGAIMLIISRRH